MSNIPHPAGGGRQQPDPDAYTIQSAAYAEEGERSAVLATAEAGALAIDPESAPALWAKLLAWRDAGHSIAAFSAPPDPSLRRVHPYYFRARFTKAQRVAFATSTDPDIIDLREAFAAADTIGLDDPRTAAGLDLMIAKGVIASGDKAALLADRRPGESP